MMAVRVQIERDDHGYIFTERVNEIHRFDMNTTALNGKKNRKLTTKLDRLLRTAKLNIKRKKKHVIAIFL